MDRSANLARLIDWAEVLDDSNYYELLGVLEIADPAGVQNAFHEFCLAFHPDAHPDCDPETSTLVRQVFQRGAEAYHVLSHPELRARYDLALATGQLRLVASDAPRSIAPPGVQSLESLCQSAAARLHATRADALISSGDLGAAKGELMLAVRADGENAG
ncbi:MAG TPA: DnaJ domain-containing protein, partial [Polyangiaceae bacterium]